MKNRIQGLVIGIIIGSLATGGVVFAKQGTELVERVYNNIKITLNGAEIIPKDANENIVEPFIIDGTTYLPVRTVGNAIGLDVDWNGENNTVILTSKKEENNKYSEATFIKGTVNNLYVNPELEYDFETRKTNILKYEKVYEEAFFLKMYGEFSNVGNHFIKFKVLAEIYPENKAEIEEKLDNMEVYTYKNEQYVNIVNIIQFFKQRNIKFDIQYNDDFAYIKK